MSASEDHAREVVAQDVYGGLDQLKELLRTKNDTSRFVGLTILKNVLDQKAQLREDAAQIYALWQSISPKFLDKLLRAHETEKITRDEAQNMVSIATAVLHTFVTLLPDDAKEEESMVGRVEGLANALELKSSNAEMVKLQLETLMSLMVSPKCSVKLLHSEGLENVLELTTDQPLAFDIVSLACSSAAIQDPALVRQSIEALMPKLVLKFKDTDAVTLLAFIAQLYQRLPQEVCFN
jgi:hypothetical protein